jgi:hypothetical protein
VCSLLPPLLASSLALERGTPRGDPMGSFSLSSTLSLSTPASWLPRATASCRTPRLRATRYFLREAKLLGGSKALRAGFLLELFRLRVSFCREEFTQCSDQFRNSLSLKGGDGENSLSRMSFNESLDKLRSI